MNFVAGGCGKELAASGAKLGRKWEAFERKSFRKKAEIDHF
jgi:hypothetical protein